jgi:hypothetical protein
MYNADEDEEDSEERHELPYEDDPAVEEPETNYGDVPEDDDELEAADWEEAEAERKNYARRTGDRSFKRAKDNNFTASLAGKKTGSDTRYRADGKSYVA